MTSISLSKYVTALAVVVFAIGAMSVPVSVHAEDLGFFGGGFDGGGGFSSENLGYFGGDSGNYANENLGYFGGSYADENIGYFGGNYADENIGYFGGGDSYIDQSGGYIDQAGGYIDQAGSSYIPSYGSSYGLGLGLSLGFGTGGYGYGSYYTPYASAYSANPIITNALPSYSVPHVTTTSGGSSSAPSYSYTTSNSCTGSNVCNTSYFDNSINGSFNDNSYRATTYTAPTVAPVYVAQPQQIIQYQFPQTYTYPTYSYPTYTNYQSTYCSISASPTYVQNGNPAYLSWSSNGYSAVLSDGIGNVSANGTLAVRPDTTRTYVLTVYGPGGSNSCSTTVSVSGVAPYVSLSQIPYTGFDYGPVGNALYWLGLASFAIAAAYLILYFKGGALALAGSTFAHKKAEETAVAAAPVAHETLVAHAAPVHVSLPTHDARLMKDTMSITRGTDGTPRIVINRA